MDESPDVPGAFDGIVGPPFESGAASPGPSSLDLYVSVAGDAMYASWAMGLEEDLKLLAQCSRGGVSLCREMIESVVPRSSSRCDQLTGLRRLT